MQGEAAHHLGRVLRAQAGQLYELSDGERVWLARVEAAGRERIEFLLVEEIPASAPILDTSLLLSIVKFDAFEWALEKATELGVSRIVPLAAARSERTLVAAAKKRAERWKKILVEASQQARRLQMPELEECRRPEKAFLQARGELKLMGSERPDAPALHSVLSGKHSKSVSLAIGPEGGWTEQEFAAARQAGFEEISLGRLILRAETAVIAALANLNYAMESGAAQGESEQSLGQNGECE